MRLFVNTRAYVFDGATRSYRVADRLLVDETRFASFDTASIGGGHTVVDLAGATVTAAFADCHLHLTDTGYLSGECDLGGARSGAEFARRVAALPRAAFVLAGNYDESSWLDGGRADPSILERALGDAYALLAPVDGHSCLVNRKTLEWLDLDPALSGIEKDADGRPTGRLDLKANLAAQARFRAAIPQALRRSAERAAAFAALAAGALHLHVQLVGFSGRDAYAAELEALGALPGIRCYPKICEPDPGLAASFGLPYVGGDVFLDGSIGGASAAMSCVYRDRPGSGTLHFADDAVERYFAVAEKLGVSAGVHAIGDAAIEQCIAAWERVLGGKPSPRNRHFVEHFELPSAEQIERCARLGIYLSMQPQFDAAWGGSGGMYERRLGAERLQRMNPLRSILSAGIVLCGGDDSPVCRLSPLAGMAAACAHHNPAERLQPLEALTMYTYDAARLGHTETHAGLLAEGYPADFVVLDRDPFVDGSFDRTRVLQTWRDGVCVYDAG